LPRATRLRPTCNLQRRLSALGFRPQRRASRCYRRNASGFSPAGLSMRQLSSALAAPAVAAALVKIKLRRGSGFGRLLSRRLNSTELLAYTPPRVCFFDRLFATRPLERFFVRPVELRRE
jgi:hypothetical protein